MTNKHYCPTCEDFTKHTDLTDQLATVCDRCNLITERMGRAETESNIFYTPDGTPATLVQNDTTKAVFATEDNDKHTIYAYDKKTGFGGITEVPKTLN